MKKAIQVFRKYQQDFIKIISDLSEPRASAYMRLSLSISAKLAERLSKIGKERENDPKITAVFIIGYKDEKINI